MKLLRHKKKNSILMEKGASSCNVEWSCKGTELFSLANLLAELSFYPHKPDLLHQLSLLHQILFSQSY